MLVLIDNFDSFTYNIVHAFEELGQEVRVFRNNVSLELIFLEYPDYLVIGPGPGNPSGAGISKECIQMAYVRDIPLLGICLGHQAIGEVFGGTVKRACRAMHGKTSRIFHTERALFSTLPQGFQVVRYHSLIVEPSESLHVIGWTEENEVMALSHPSKPIVGVQFHPESVASECGAALLRNFLNLRKSSSL